MAANESSHKVYLRGRFDSKVIYQKCVSFNTGNDYSLKD